MSKRNKGKFMPIIVRYDSYGFNGITGRKMFGLSLDKKDNYRIILEGEDFTIQNKISSYDVAKLSDWLIKATQAILEPKSRTIAPSKEDVRSSEFIKKINEDIYALFTHNPIGSLKYKYMFQIDVHGMSLLFALKEKELHDLISTSNRILEDFEKAKTNNYFGDLTFEDDLYIDDDDDEFLMPITNID